MSDLGISRQQAVKEIEEIVNNPDKQGKVKIYEAGTHKVIASAGEIFLDSTLKKEIKHANDIVVERGIKNELLTVLDIRDFEGSVIAEISWTE